MINKDLIRMLLDHPGDIEVWYDASLHVTVPALGLKPLEVSASVTVTVPWAGEDERREEAAREAARKRFRALGFDKVMDMRDATVAIHVVLT